MKLRFIPDALFNQVPEAKLRYVHLTGTMEVLNDELVSIHLEQKDMKIDLDRNNRDGEFGNYQFEMPTDVYLRADYVGLSVVAAPDSEGRTVAWPMRVKLRDLVAN